MPLLTQTPADLETYWDEKNYVVKQILLKLVEAKRYRELLPGKVDNPPKQLYY